MSDIDFGRMLFEESAIRLVEEGCVTMSTAGGEELSADALRAILDEYGEFPTDFQMRITEKGRDVLARGRP